MFTFAADECVIITEQMNVQEPVKQSMGGLGYSND